MAEHNELGKWGENIACDTLVAKGCAILERNWRSGHYEVDIIARRGIRIIFTEVKTRHNPGDDPLLAFDEKKQRRLARAADAYLRLQGIPFEAQFDFIGITGGPQDYKVEHLEDVYINLLNIHSGSARR